MTPGDEPEHGLLKSIWTDADFDAMGWHDARFYCFTVFAESSELVVDLDYITRWIHPVHPDIYFRFWISPATLVFHDVQNISAVIEMRELFNMEVVELKRTPLPGRISDWRWQFDLSNGEIALDASGYTQYFRRKPVLREYQHLEFAERGGISYARETFDGSG